MPYTTDSKAVRQRSQQQITNNPAHDNWWCRQSQTTQLGLLRRQLYSSREGESQKGFLPVPWIQTLVLQSAYAKSGFPAHFASKSWFSNFSAHSSVTPPCGLVRKCVMKILMASCRHYLWVVLHLAVNRIKSHRGGGGHREFT